MHSVQTENERTPILPDAIRRSRAIMEIRDRLFIFVLVLIFLVGLIIGLYLIITEGHEWRVPGIFNITSRELWGAHPPSFPIPELKLPARNVLFLSMNSTSCDTKFHCTKLISELQLKHIQQLKEPDILYSFVMSEAGEMFEGRGWNFQATFPDYTTSNVVTISFLGEFRWSAPTSKQSDAAKLFIDASIMEGNLEPCVNILVWGENRFFFDLARNIQNSLNGCDGPT